MSRVLRVPPPPRPSLPSSKRDRDNYVVTVGMRIPIPSGLMIGGYGNSAPWSVADALSTPTLIGNHGSGYTARTTVIGHYKGAPPSVDTVHKVIVSASDTITPRGDGYGSASGFTLTGNVSNGSTTKSISNELGPNGWGWSHIPTNYNNALSFRWFDILTSGHWSFDVDLSSFIMPTSYDGSNWYVVPWKSLMTNALFPIRLVFGIVSLWTDYMETNFRMVGTSSLSRIAPPDYSDGIPCTTIDGTFEVDVDENAFDDPKFLGIRVMPFVVVGDDQGGWTAPRAFYHDVGGAATLLDRIYYLINSLITVRYSHESLFDPTANGSNWRGPFSVSGMVFP